MIHDDIYEQRVWHHNPLDYCWRTSCSLCMYHIMSTCVFVVIHASCLRSPHSYLEYLPLPSIQFDYIVCDICFQRSRLKWRTSKVVSIWYDWKRRKIWLCDRILSDVFLHFILIQTFCSWKMGEIKSEFLRYPWLHSTRVVRAEEAPA